MTHGNKGKKHSKEQNEKTKQRMLANPIRYWLGKKRPNISGENSPTKRKEVRNKISKSNIGKHSGKKPPRSIEHRKHISESKKGIPRPDLKGENNHMWIKDRNKLKIDREKAYDTKYKYWMLEVKKRDNWKCKLLNKECFGKLEAHHILSWKEYQELRYDINNGITLCHAHHPRKRAEEKRLIPIFQELVSVLKE